MRNTKKRTTFYYDKEDVGMDNFDNINENDVVVLDKLSKYDKFKYSNVVVTPHPKKITKEWMEAFNAINAQVSMFFIMTPLGSFIVYRDGKLVEDGGLDEWNI